jgi:hypothetical protein
MSVVALVDAWRDRRPVRWFRFDPDGAAHFPPIFDEPSTRADLFRKALSMRRGWFETHRPVSALQREALAEVLTLSRAHAVRVLAYLPPNHPYLLTYWRSAPWFDRAAAATVRFLWATPGVNLTVCDFRDPTSLGRPAGDELYDVVHPTKALNDEIVARLETGRCRPERSASGGRP